MKAAAALLFVMLVGLSAGCADDEGAETVSTSACARVLYEGQGEPNLIVVSDLPLRGVHARTTKLMVEAIEFVFRQRGFSAGEHRVGYQSCNDTLGDEPYDATLCKRNASAYVETKDVVGIIGPWNSGCAIEQIPIVSRTAAGPLAMVSPSNTYAGLTRTVPGAGEPLGSALYPDGVRSYARVVTHDQAQGIAAAHLAERQGAQRVVVLQGDLDDPYVRGLADPFVTAARSLGLQVRRFEWPRRQSYTQLARDVAAARPDTVFLAGLTENAKTLVEDLRAELGAEVVLIAPDSFAASEVARELGPAGEGMLLTVPGIPPDVLPPAGKSFLRSFGHPAVQTGQGAPEAAQAAEVLLDAIGRSDGTRASVVAELFATKVENGILGSFSFDRYGDIVPAPVGVYRIRDREIVTHGVVRAPLDAIDE